MGTNERTNDIIRRTTRLFTGAALLCALSGCSFISVSLPSSLFGIDDKNASNAGSSSGPSSWFVTQNPNKTYQNRRKPLYNPGSGMGSGMMSGSNPYGGYNSSYGNTGGMARMGMGGDQGGFNPYQGGEAPMPYSQNTPSMSGPPSLPSFNMPSGGGDMSGYSMPDVSKSDIQQQMNQWGLGKSSNGSYNPFLRYKAEAHFEPMAATYTLAFRDSYPPLSDIPETPKKLQQLHDSENKDALQKLEQERDEANFKNLEIRDPEAAKAAMTPPHDAVLATPAPEAPAKPEEPSFIEKIKQFITFSDTDETHRFDEPESPSLAESPATATTPVVMPYQLQEDVVLKPSRYEQRREALESK